MDNAFWFASLSLNCWWTSNSEVKGMGMRQHRVYCTFHVVTCGLRWQLLALKTLLIITDCSYSQFKSLEVAVRCCSSLCLWFLISVCIQAFTDPIICSVESPLFCSLWYMEKMHQGSSSVALEICSRPDNLEQASANQNPQAISSMPPALLNKIILDHSVFIALCITDGRGEELWHQSCGCKA